MTFYNAIILDEKERIVGRTHITNLSRFYSPSSKYIARHEESRLTERCPSPLDSVMITPHNPIAIIKRYDSDGRFKVKVSTLLGKIIPFFVTRDTTVEDLKGMIEDKEGIPADQQRLIFVGRQLEDAKRLVDYDVTYGDKVHLVLRLRGGGGMNMKDLEGETITGSGKTIDSDDVDTWKAFSFGFNIIGRCDNGNCKSNKSGSSYPPVLNRGLSHCRLTGDDEPFKCPACECKTFQPANFLVAGARSAINFRKSGESQIKSTVLESPGEYPKYAKYADSNDTVEYDEIQVRTTHLDESPFFCNLCSTFILHRSSEVGQPCGHYFHKECAGIFKDCPICRADLLIGEAVEELFEM